MRGVVLIGYRGSGKTTVGKRLAECLGLPFVDTDEHVERRAGKPIPVIFEEDGELAFRTLEAEAIAEACAGGPKVLSVGGGAVLRHENIERCRASGMVVWLRADAGTLWSRIARDAASGHERPPLTSLRGLAEVQQVLAEREPLYRRAADCELDASGDGAGQIVQRIVEFLAHHGHQA